MDITLEQRIERFESRMYGRMRELERKMDVIAKHPLLNFKEKIELENDDRRNKKWQKKNIM